MATYYGLLLAGGYPRWSACALAWAPGIHTLTLEPPAAAMTPRPVLVTGGTGRIGTAFVQQMVARGIPVRLGTRRLEAADVALRRRFGPALVEPVLLPPEDPQRLQQAFAGCRGALLVAPFGEMEAWHRAMGAAARAAGVGHLVKVSVTGARGPEADPPPGRIPSLHWQGEEALRALDLPLTVIRPTIFAQHLLGLSPAVFRPGDAVIHLPTGSAAVAFLDCRDIAECAAALLADPALAAAWAGQAFELTGPSAVTATEVAEILSLVGERPIGLVDGLDRFSAHAAALGVPDLVKGIYAEAAGGWFSAVQTAEFQAITGRHPTSFASFAHDHRHYFQALV